VDHAERDSPDRLDHEVAVAHGIERVRRDPVESELGGRGFAIERVPGAGERPGSDRWQGLSQKYYKHSFFRFISDHGYAFIAKHRAPMFFLSKLLWGKDPSRPKKYWMIYLACLLALLVILVIIPVF
jgi:hypothetical protein